MVMVEPIASAGDMPVAVGAEDGPGTGPDAGRLPGASITWIATVLVSASILAGPVPAGGGGAAEVGCAGGAATRFPPSCGGVSGRSTQ
jgi:hypothetical protein